MFRVLSFEEELFVSGGEASDFLSDRTPNEVVRDALNRDPDYTAAPYNGGTFYSNSQKNDEAPGWCVPDNRNSVPFQGMSPDDCESKSTQTSEVSDSEL